MQAPIYNYPSLGLSCHWHAVCQQLAGCTGIIDALEHNKEIAMKNALDEINRLDKDLTNAKTEHQIKIINEDIERIKHLEESIDFLFIALKAAHDFKYHQKYTSNDVNVIHDSIKKYYDIDVFKTDLIMVDFAKVYEYCLKYVCPKDLLYASIVNDNTAMEKIIDRYSPKYVLIPSTELGANLEKNIANINYRLISITKGRGHFYCEHIVDDKALQFDDMCEMNNIKVRSVDDLLHGIARSELKRQIQRRYLRPDIIDNIRTETNSNDSDEVISLKYVSKNENDYDKRTFIIEETVDQTLYAMAMLMKEN